MHPEAITSKQREILKDLLIPPQFYLVGGTALALQIGHRVSVDFDFFVHAKKLPEKLVVQVENKLSGRKIEVLLQRDYQFTFRVEGVEATYFAYPFKPLFPFVRYGKIPMLSVREIALSKAHTIGRRAAFKDYVDLYFILKENHITLENILKLAKKKYGDEFDARLFLEQLVYLEDILPMNITFLNKRVSKSQLQTFFEAQIRTIKIESA